MATLQSRPYARRAQEIAELRMQGLTLQEIASRYSLTRERVRQILEATGGPTHAEVQRVRHATQLALHRDAVLEQFERLRQDRDVARTLGLPAGLVTEIINANVQNPHLRRRRLALKPKYADDELLACLREAHRTVGGDLITQPTYTRIARSRRFVDGRPWPSVQLYRKRFDRWTAALQAAGITSVERPAKRRERFQPDDCVRALRGFVEMFGELPTVAAYDEYARAYGGELPGAQTIRARCGGWYAALLKAGF